jgi:hypothetical protein
MSIPEDEQQNYELFRDCLATVLHERISEPQAKTRRRTKAKSKKKPTISSATQDVNSALSNEKYSTDSPKASSHIQPASTRLEVAKEGMANKDSLQNDDDLAEFTDYIATLTFTSLPPELRTADYHTYTTSPEIQAHYASRVPLTGSDIPTLLPLLDPDISASLSAYGITDEAKQGISEFLAGILTSYLTLLSTPPPAPSATKADVDGCEICDRDWINLTYHHLIPRFVHAKAVKRGWHRECDLQNVAWLCGACHRFVHRFANHEDLARKFYTVDLLLEQEEVKRWASWVGRLRWKGR